MAVSVYKGNTSDGQTFLPQVRKLREQFGLEHMVLIGDRGMISKASIAALRQEEFSWITALKAAQIRSLIEAGTAQIGLFDQRNLLEITHPEFPGERLMACRNPELAKLRAHTRTALLEATTKELEKVRGMVARARLQGRDQIGVRVGKVINKFKVAKHFELNIEDTRFDFKLRQAQIDAEAMLDGLYVIRTDLKAETMSAAETVRNYKALSSVERAFRCLKSVDLKVRPIHHRRETRVRAHIFLCMLAYYVEWHMRAAWRELLFADEDQDAKARRDPVAPAARSAAALQKISRRSLDDGTPLQSFRTLLQNLETLARITCRSRAATSPAAATFKMTTPPNSAQRRALELIETLQV